MLFTHFTVVAMVTKIPANVTEKIYPSNEKDETAITMGKGKKLVLFDQITTIIQINL